MFESLTVPVLFAHRGASAHAPENTLPAFELAISQGVEAIEIDVQLSADGSVVVIHDSTVSRTTNGTGKVNQHTLDHLKSLNAGVEFGSAYPDVEIPTLNEVFSDLNSNIFINVELKNFQSPLETLAAKVAKIVQDHHAENRVLFSSFSPVALRKISQYLPEAPKGLLLYNPFLVDLYLIFPQLISVYQSINISLSCVTKRRINLLHKLGKKVFTYTLNQPAEIRHALNCGSDGFFTDDPALGLRTLSGSGYNSI